MAKLARLNLTNYRNIPSLEINFAGKDGCIVGMNQIGKTNCIEAICYLLTDKLLGGSADIPSIKPHGNEKAKVTVEASFFTDDGEVVLRKEFYEKWVKPRGSEFAELQGHATDYYINGAKQARAKDFYDALQDKFGIPTEISNLDAYQLVIDPFYLGEKICGSKDWKYARKAIIDIIGDVMPEEIYSMNPKLEIVRDNLKAHQYDDGETKKAIRGEVDGYKKKIAENEGILNEYRTALGADCTEEEYQLAKTASDQIDDQIAKLRLGSENPYSDEVRKLQAEQFNIQQELNRQQKAASVVDHTKSEALRKKALEKQDELMKATNDQRSVQLDIIRITSDINERAEKQNQYKAKLAQLKEAVQSLMVEETCPTCGQRLPEDKIQEAFNMKKAEIIKEAEEIKRKATENKEAFAKATEALSALKTRDFTAEISKLNLEYTELCKSVQNALSEETASVKKVDPKLTERSDEIVARLNEIRALREKGSQGAYEQIEELKARKSEAQAIMSKRTYAIKAKERISAIEAENLENGRKQADAEQRLWAVGEYVKTKLQLLDDHMTSKLGEVRFQLIKENIKAGSYDEVCIPYIIDQKTGLKTKTLFQDGSKSEQIYTGCRIIKAIRDAKKWQPLPIIFDQGGELDAKSSGKVSYDAEAQIIAVKVAGTQTVPTFVESIQ